MRDLRSFPKTTKMSSIANLPTEMLTEILVRLPVRSLLSCKCVCKTFLSVVKTPDFIDRHISRTRNDNTRALMINFSDGVGCVRSGLNSNLQFLLSIDKNTKDVLSSSYAMPRIPIVGEIQLVGSCNGLLCAQITTFDHDGSNKISSLLLLLNPVTRQSRYLPRPHISSRSVVHEFGFVPETNDYKVVSVVFDRMIDELQIEVYKMSTDSWTITEHKMSLETNTTLLNIYPNQTSMFLNGAFHWVQSRRIDAHGYLIGTFIVSFNIKDEELGLMKALECDRVSLTDERKLAVIDKSLAMIYFRHTGEFEIWVMNDYGVQDSWAVQCRVAGSLLRFGWPLGYWTNGLMVIGEDMCTGTRAFLYDLNTEERKEIPRLEYFYINKFYGYVETLASVNGRNFLAEANQ